MSTIFADAYYYYLAFVNDRTADMNLWKKRWFAITFTVGTVLLTSAVFTLLFHNPVEDKPIFFLRMMWGPLGQIQDLGDCFVALPFVSLVMLYPVFPSWGTFVLTCVGIFFWWGSGFIAATGGV